MYYADINSAQRRTPGPLAAGSRVAVLGIEGSRPTRSPAIAIGAGDRRRAAASSPAPPASRSAVGAERVASAPAEDMWRVDGTVETVTRVHRRPARAGWPHPVRGLSQLSESTWRTLRPGERISLFGAPRDDRRLIANGFIQAEGPPPAASPRLGR